MDAATQARVKIDITDVIVELETIYAQVRREFSGFGWGKWFRQPDGSSVYKIYRYKLLDVGTAVFTQIEPQDILPLLNDPDLANMHVWQHSHPMGDAREIGPHNWSGMDDHTARFEPLGSTPEMAHWSISIVRTPTGWAGRLDNYGKNATTLHCEVFPNPLLDLLPTIKDLSLRAEGKYRGNAYSEIPVGDEQFEDRLWENGWEIEPDDDEEREDDDGFFQGLFTGMFG
jgi:hypothetical protein